MLMKELKIRELYGYEHSLKEPYLIIIPKEQQSTGYDLSYISNYD
jgi:hypothetical protein